MNKRLWLSALALLSVLAVACGVDLGPCEPEQMPYTGQELVQNTCTSCHSAKLEGRGRQGAPAGLNFDVPATAQSDYDVRVFNAGLANVKMYAEDIYAVAESGTMPPSGEVSDLDALRNWLACGAPAVVPQVIDGEQLEGFDGVHALLNETCNQCHSEESGASFGMFVFGRDKCLAYSNLVGVQGHSGDCTQFQYVVPGNPDQSMLLSKMTANPVCGASMPANGGPPYQVDNPRAFEATRTWIADGAPKPADCP